MASGDSLGAWGALSNEPPDADYAELDEILSTSTDEPDDVFPILDFDPGATNEHVVISFVMPSYYDGTTGVTLRITWTTEATSGNAKWDAAFKRLNAGTNILTKTYAAVNSTTTAANGTARVTVETTITFTDGADMDSVVANEWCHLLITRDSADVGDTINSNDLELQNVYLTET